MTGANMQVQDAGKAFKSEWEALEVAPYSWVLADVEKRLMKQIKSSSIKRGSLSCMLDIAK